MCSDLVDRPSPSHQDPRPARKYVPVVSIVVPFFGLTSSIFRILKGNPHKGATMETIGKFYVKGLP